MTAPTEDQNSQESESSAQSSAERWSQIAAAARQREAEGYKAPSPVGDLGDTQEATRQLHSAYVPKQKFKSAGPGR